MSYYDDQYKLFSARLARAEEVKTLLTKAFRVLRGKEHRMIARQSFSCCRNCAGYELAEMIETRIKKGTIDPKTFGGSVFYTKQSKMIEGGGWRTTRFYDVYLSFGPVEVDEVEYGPDTKKVGETIVKVFEDLGVPYEWSGDPNTCIKVVPFKGRPELEEAA